jgi:flagellar hook-length control protein FliK
MPGTARPIAAAGESAGGESAGGGSTGSENARGENAGGRSTAGAGSVPSLAEAASTGDVPTALADAAQAPPVDYGVGLQQAIETAHSAIQFAARQGLSQARIALQPEELGEIRIYLSQSAGGLVARLTAQTPAAAQALAAGHAELRQSLSSIGVSLAHLDIGLDQSGGAAAGGGGQGSGHRADGQASLGAGHANRAAASEGHEDTDAEPTAEEALTAPAPSSGALVDVLA